LLDIMSRCGKISHMQKHIEKERLDIPQRPNASPGRRHGAPRSIQETRQISPAPSRPKAPSVSSPGPPVKQVATPPSKRVPVARVGPQQSPSRRRIGTPVQSSARQPSPSCSRKSDIRSTSPLKSTLRQSASGALLIRHGSTARLN